MDAEPFALFGSPDEEADWIAEYLGFMEQEQPTELPVKTKPYERID